MKTLDFSKIIFPERKYYPPYQRKKPEKMPQIVGWDTETRKGKAFLLMSSCGHRALDFTTVKMLDVLFTAENTLNFFWNIDYDFQAILKGISKDEMYILYKLGTIEAYGYKIDYIPKKYFSLKKGRHTAKFYDLMQFYNCGLNAAALKILGEKKKDDIDVLKFADLSYIRTNKVKILEYCRQDCDLTAKLGIHFAELCLSMGISPQKPYSAAFISSLYFKKNSTIPLCKNMEVMKYAYAAYYGGRFETFKTGHFKELFVYDLKSAYPSMMRKLIDITKGEWIFSTAIPDNAYYGFLRCRLTCKDAPIQPFPRRINGLISFPIMQNRLTTVTLAEYLFFIKNGLGAIQVLDGWFFVPFSISYPFALIENLYAVRQKLKLEKNPQEFMVKLILNSFYGKTMQLVRQYVAIPGMTGKDFSMPPDAEFIGSKIYTPHYKAGDIFNPVYGAIITADTRLRLLEIMLEKPGAVVGCYTDSIFATEPILDGRTGEALGDWDLQGVFEGVILGTGVYSLRNAESEVNHLRGFFHAKQSLFKLLAENASRKSVPLKIKKNVMMGEWLMHETLYAEEDFNIITEYPRCIMLNFDTKRIWKKKFKNCGEALKITLSSEPLTEVGKTLK